MFGRSRLPCLALAAAVAMAACDDEPLPVIATLPDFALTDHEGQPFSSGDMTGRVWVVNFVFTSCPSICPALTERMASIQQRYSSRRAELGLLSFSVDPVHDTPDVLRAYAQGTRADPRMWRFLTGSTLVVSDTVVRGFRVTMGEPEPIAGGRYEIMHSSHFVLVDRARRIRGYYASDDEGMAALSRDTERLLEESPP